MGKFVSKNNLSYFWQKIKTLLSGKADKSEIPDTSGLAKTSDLDNYLPLTAGSTKPLTDDLYVTSKKSIRLGNKAYLMGDDTDGRLTISPGKDRILTIRPNPDNSTGQMHIYGTTFRPGSKDGVQLGDTSAPWSKIYGTEIYQNGKQVANKEDIPTVPTVNNGTLTIQKNGTNVATFTANQSGNSTANLIIPTSASDVSALPDTTKYGASLSLTMNTTTYVLTAQLKDQSGNNLGTAQTIDLPLESVVVSGSYDKSTKKVVLTLKDGSTVDFSVADLVSGLVPNTRKVNGKALSSDITLTASDVGALPSSTTIPTVNNGKLTIKRNNTEVGSFTANQSGNTSINIEVPSLDGVVKTTGSQTIAGTKTFSDGILLGSSTERGTSTGSIDIEGDVLNAPNLNDITQRGIYHCTKGTNVPTFDYTNSQYDLMVFESEENGVSLVTQMAVVGWKWYIRRYNGTWGAWERFGQSTTPNNGTLTIQKNGSNVATFTANASSNATANITVPTALSEMTQSASYRTVTDTEKSTWNAKSNFSGSYTDLTNKPTIPSLTSVLLWQNASPSSAMAATTITLSKALVSGKNYAIYYKYSTGAVSKLKLEFKYGGTGYIGWLNMYDTSSSGNFLKNRLVQITSSTKIKFYDNFIGATYGNDSLIPTEIYELPN